MADQATPEDKAPKKKPYVPKPPSREELDQLSRDQALITDEWAGDQPAKPA